MRRGPSVGLRAGRQQTTGRLPGAARAAHTRRLARGGSEAESASMSLNGGSSPSTFAVPVSGSDRRLAAKERAAAKDKSADHRRVNAEMAAALEGGGADVSFAEAQEPSKLPLPLRSPVSMIGGYEGRERSGWRKNNTTKVRRGGECEQFSAAFTERLCLQPSICYRHCGQIGPGRV